MERYYRDLDAKIERSHRELSEKIDQSRQESDAKMERYHRETMTQMERMKGEIINALMSHSHPAHHAPPVFTIALPAPAALEPADLAAAAD